MSLGYREVFRRCVERYGGDVQMKSFRVTTSGNQ